MNRSKRLFLMAVFLTVFHTTEAWADTWKITAYDPCKRCCGKTDGITASGHKGHYGYVACNWLKFGTRVNIEGLGTFVVEDRGAKSLFGSKSNHIKHLDVFMNSHKEARQFGVQYREVTVLQ